MPAGLTIFNPDNTIQIDETYRNLMLMASGQYTVNASTPINDKWYTDLLPIWRRLSPFALMAVRTTGTQGLSLNPGSYRNGVKICNFRYVPNSSVTFQYYIFDLVSPLSNNLGLQVFDPTGKLVFDALDYPLEVITSIKTRESIPSVLIHTAPHSNIALACIGGGYVVDDDGEDLEESLAYTYITGPNIYTYTRYTTQESAGGVGWYGIIEMHGLLINTSNYPLTYVRP